MTNTTRLYRAVADYMSARAAAREVYLLTRQRYAAARGSRMYTEEMTKAKEKREKTVSAAQDIARLEIRETIRDMADKAGKIKMQPPTEAQLRILQMLSLRNHLTEAELDSAANSMDGNASALSLLDELARSKAGGIHVPYATRLSVKTYDPKTALDIVQNLAKECYVIVNETTGADSISLMMAQKHSRLYGGIVDPDELPEAKAFEDEAAFYEHMQIPHQAFSNAVD